MKEWIHNFEENIKRKRKRQLNQAERILEEKKPKSFLLENVKGLTNHDHGRTFKIMLDILENKLNYKVYYKVLNAKNFRTTSK